MGNETLLADTLSLSVPLEILELERRGGPTEDDLSKARAYGAVLAEKGDLLLYRSEKKGETARLFAGLVQAIAVLAFFPGGIKIFGMRFEAKAGELPEEWRTRA